MEMPYKNLSHEASLLSITLSWSYGKEPRVERIQRSSGYDAYQKMDWVQSEWKDSRSDQEVVWYASHIA
jgi:hypothetical protein